MGQGMVIVSPDPEGVIRVAQQNRITAQQIGVVTNKSTLIIKNRGAFNPFENSSLRNIGPEEINYHLYD
mgnify:CR=1 FL=1